MPMIINPGLHKIFARYLALLCANGNQFSTTSRIELAQFEPRYCQSYEVKELLMQKQPEIEIEKDEPEQTPEQREKQVPRREQASTDVVREKIPTRNSRAEIQNPLMHESY